MLKNLHAESLFNLMSNGAKVNLPAERVSIEVNHLEAVFDGTLSDDFFRVKCLDVKDFPISLEGAENALSWVNSEVDEFVRNCCD
jgi:hypothetical protein